MNFQIRWTAALWALICLAPGASPVSAVDNIDPDNDGSQYAYGENIGWLNAEPSGDGGPGIQVGDLELTGYMWGENIGWVSLSCSNTSSCDTEPYGVMNDGQGVLSGFAWGENVGWISFSCANTDSCRASNFGVRIDPTSGQFSGQAWGENIGFISFASEGPVAYGIKSGWAACSPVTATPSIDLARAAASTTLSWTEVPGATAYDVVRGDLGTLLSTGSFTTATAECTAEDATGTTLLVDEDPAPGAGYWFLVRAVGCSTGSYDSLVVNPEAPRDAAIEASGNGCD